MLISKCLPKDSRSFNWLLLSCVAMLAAAGCSTRATSNPSPSLTPAASTAVEEGSLVCLRSTAIVVFWRKSTSFLFTRVLLRRCPISRFSFLGGKVPEGDHPAVVWSLLHCMTSAKNRTQTLCSSEGRLAVPAGAKELVTQRVRIP
jgi:hypothetical protein